MAKATVTLKVTDLQQGIITPEMAAELAATFPEPEGGWKLNCGSGEWLLPRDQGWINLDADPAVGADICARVPPIPLPDEAYSEVYAGHFLEHLAPNEADRFLAECYRVLKPGGKFGIVVPDTRAIVQQYLAGEGTFEFPQQVYHPLADLDEVCACFLYSTVQDSPHRWSYDLETLRRKLLRAGFYPIAEIDRMSDPRIPVHGWWQCGWDAVKSGGS